VTTDVCPEVCLVCGYLTYGLDLCYFCRLPVAETPGRQVRQTCNDSGSASRSRPSRNVQAAS
jgi:hypothetical protein